MGMRKARVVRSEWTQRLQACSTCGHKHQALLRMTDGRKLCVACEHREAAWTELSSPSEALGADHAA